MATAQKQNTRSSGAICSVHGCHYSQRTLNSLLAQPCFDHKPLTRKECSCQPPYRLHRMPPNDADLQRQWLAALNRKSPPKNVFVCSFHFVDREPTQDNPVPELYLGYKKTTFKKRRVLVRTTASANINAIELSIPGNRKRKSSTTADASPAKQLCLAAVESSHSEDEGVMEMPCTSDSSLLSATPGEKHVTTMDASTQWIDIHIECHDYSKPWLQNQREQMLLKTKAENDAKKTKHNDATIQCQISEDQGVAATLIKTDSDAKLYCGIPFLVFTTLVTCLLPHADRTFRMPVADQILMTLMKLKLNLLYADLARRFSVSESLVSKTVSYWIDTMASHLSMLIVWLPRETIRATMPKCFKRHYPKTTCVLDCAETIMQKASNLRSRGESYSNYKSHNTVKYCVSIAPCGLVMHISRAYGGRASDKFIVQDSGVLDRLLPGDEVMADRGFTIQDLLFTRRVSLNIPAFSHGKQLPDQEVTRTRRIANVRIHVERAIRRMKVFRILKDTVPVSMTKKIDKILRICAALVNLGSDLIKEKVEADE